MSIRMKTKSTVSRIVFYLGATAALGCGEAEQNWIVGTDHPTDTSSELSEDSDTMSDTGSETETAFPELPELCVRETELNGGLETGQFPLSGTGSAVTPAIGANRETDELLFAYAYIESGAPTWAVMTTPYRAAVETVDGGSTVIREVGEISSPSPADAPGKSPSAAYGHGAFGLVWLDGRYDPACNAENDDNCLMDVVFLRVDADGVASGDPVVLTDAALGRPAGRPAVAALLDGFLVVWPATISNETRLAVVRLDDAGTPLEEAFLLEDTLVDSVFPPSVAANDDTAVIVFTDARQTGVSARIWPAGEDRPENPFALSESDGKNTGAVIAAGQGGFLTAWTGMVDKKPQILMRTLDAFGEVAGEVQQATWANNVGNPAVAAHDDIYAVAWSATHDNGEEKCAVPDWCAEQIFAAIVDADGHSAAAAVRLSEDPNESRNMQIAWDGVGLTAVWETWRLNRWQLFFGQMTCE